MRTNISDKETTPTYRRGAGLIAIALVVGVCFLILFLLVGCEPYESANEEDVATLPAFDELDADADGFVTSAEAETADVVILNFEQTDANRDGVLDENEYGTLTPNVDVLENSEPLENDY